MSWLWFDLCPDLATGPLAWARVSDTDGSPRGVLCAWADDQDRPTPTAAKVDSRAIDPSGDAGSMSLVLAPDGLYLPFDDPAVAHATRMVLAMPPADVCSTLVDGDDRFRGSITGMHGDDGRLGYDPFAVLFPAVVSFALVDTVGTNGVVVLTGVSGGDREAPVAVDRLNLEIVLSNKVIVGSVNANRRHFETAVADMEEIQRRWPGWLERMITRRVAHADYSAGLRRGPDDVKVVVEIRP